ncbi:aminoglycoside phosphotransferase family protein [Marinococcus sp. PL1-022]|uniref:aminoglycoside phosphotransferase family protein n=1 Tax=Marinococcus sp. PL1-022 TaxID=3095363 RepID=UPI0029C200C1|nr:aminoglycoside phosphotransferase family protein [Marinococcus sp. PL1-022]MDX6152768.1 aminoglycoside phosphotransferase family protein [Marinococcus sp. PL1-022]
MIPEGFQQYGPVKNALTIRSIQKGFSGNGKFILDDTYVLKTFPVAELEERMHVFHVLNRLGEYSRRIPRAIDIGKRRLDGGDEQAFMLMTYLPGDDAEAVLSSLSQKHQYEAGVDASKELARLHELEAPPAYPDWKTVKIKKIDRYFGQLNNTGVDEETVHLLQTYIKKNEYLMTGRPNRFQHDDFHPSNLLIAEERFQGIIDFDRMDWGDPVHDLQKTGFFTKNVSRAFSRGCIDGYLEATDFDEGLFWRLYALYSAVHIVSAIAWAYRESNGQYQKLLRYSKEAIWDHDYFNKSIPEWYWK